MKYLPWTAVTLWLAGTLAAAELELVRDGKPMAVIVVAEDAPPPERFAAKELQRAIRLMSGAELEVRSSASEEENALMIAHRADGGEGEKIRVKREGKKLMLQGKTPGEAVHATYEFLRRFLHARWLWPGESGEFLPRQSTISVGEIDFEYVPSIPYRSMAITSVSHGFSRDTDLWMLRNGMNLQSIGPKTPEKIIRERKERGLLLRVAGHNVKLPQELLEKHPEYAALFGGKRRIDTRVPPQLCWSNPDVVDLIAEEIGKWWELPGVDFVAPYSSDNTHFCECEGCVAMGDVSTRWQKFSIQVMEKLKPKYPNAKYMTLAYQSYRKVPNGPIAPFINNGYCLYNGCYRHTYQDNCDANPLALRELKEWQALGGQMGIRGYEMIMFREAMFVPLVGFMVDQAKWAKEHRLVSIATETPPYGHPKDKPAEEQRWASNRISYYAAARAMWDASVTSDEIIDDWHNTVFGAASAPMAEYYRTMEKAWRSTPGHITYFLNPVATYCNGFVTPELVETVEALFARARKAAETVNDVEERSRIEKEIAFEQRLFERWKQLYLIQLGRQDRMVASAIRASERPKVKAEEGEVVWLKAPLFPPFEDKDGAIVKEQTEVRALWDEEALYLRFVCHHLSGTPIKALFTNRDEAVFGDDAIEIFFNPDPASPAYVHLAINSLGTIWDARSEAGMNLDKKWNGDWQVAASVQRDRWVVDVRIPFAAFGIVPKEGKELALNFTRARPGRLEGFPSSGWPDSSVHNPSGYGQIRLVKEAPVSIGFYSSKGEALLAAMVQQQLKPVRITSEDGLRQFLKQSTVGGLILRYPWERGAELSLPFFRKELYEYVRDGGRVMIVTRTDLPLAQWFPDENMAVAWTKDPPHPVRKVILPNGDTWLESLGQWSQELLRATPPRNGLRPLSTGWQTLASFKLADGAEVPFLLRRKVGNGELILTSSWFGFGGRHEVFGDGNGGNAAMLVSKLFSKKPN